MRLNSTHKQAIIRAVIADVPRKYPVDITIEKITGGIKNFLMVQMDARVAAVWRDPATAPALSMACSENIVEYLGMGAWDFEINGRRHCISMPTYERSALRKLARNAPEFQHFRDLLQGLIKEQERLDALKVKLEGALAAVQTRKKLVSLFPEFEKYAPADTDPSSDRSLPALANVVTDLMQLGWPDGGKQLNAA